MIALLIVLTLVSFLQATFWPINLVLIILISRAFVTSDKITLWLSFGFGLLLALLSGYPLGSLSLIYLLIIVLVRLVRNTHLASHWLIILPLSWIMLLLDQFLQSLILGTGFRFLSSLLPLIFVLPIYLAVRFWEERFIPRPAIKLKIGK
ncbi:hypothetical protein HY385_02320 [Candidatus Daviesbacteria bacterium]|nr:hypothetical protein [Candidatus Daviesbacteria bacterium]